MEKYTLNIENSDSLTDSARINQFIKAFADTKYESEYIDRIAIARDSYMKYDGTELSDTTKGKFLLRHENSLMFKDMLQHLKVQNKDNEYPVANYMTIQQNNKSDGYRFFILYDFLIQFAVVAMFIGIFIQMIFEEKNITEN